MIDLQKSKAAFEEARKFMPGGVNSPVRSYPHMGCPPPFIASAKGSHITDIDGNTYIDYVGSWGPMILGHAHPAVISAICKAAENSTSYGAPTLKETEIAELIHSVYPSIEKIRMVNSGTEATMSALRAARGYTGRDKILKFEGCYHGHGDSLLVKAGSGAATFGKPDSAGVTKGTAKDTLVTPYNDIPAFKAIMDAEGDEIAAVIVEPVAGNMGCVLPVPGFLEALREETAKYGTVLIFDEVMCGFRTSSHGAQSFYHIHPDMTCLGKIIGGGLPAAAYGGRKEIMACIAPDGSVYQAGTLSGNPLAVTAGIETIRQMMKRQVLFWKDGRNLQTRQAFLSSAISPDPCSAFSSPKRMSLIIRTPVKQMQLSSRHGSFPCLTSMFTWHHPRSKHCSCPGHIQMRISNVPLQHPARQWRKLQKRSWYLQRDSA